ncbi:MAG: hypothetical protein ACJ8F7_17105 [Gemmataceae bacterium]
MFDEHESLSSTPDAPAMPEPSANGHVEEMPPLATAETAPEAEPVEEPTSRRHADAGRKGAHRVHQLIQEGRLYEEEHGLTSGRQRLRQLIELGKLYEQEKGLRTGGRKKRVRLSRAERGELMATLLRCLQRIAKPSYRADLARLSEVLRPEQNRAA